MTSSPKSVRLHIGFFGRMNVGKSSLMNYLAGQEVAITSDVPGTTTDVVEKPVEWLPLGPVVFLDTAGLDDASELAAARMEKMNAARRRTDVAILVVEAGGWTAHEERLLAELRAARTPVLLVFNKSDVRTPDAAEQAAARARVDEVAIVSCRRPDERETAVRAIKEAVGRLAPAEFSRPPPLVSDLLPAGGLLAMVVPIDLQAPKGRLILPQVQTLREALDSDAAALVVKEREYAEFLTRLNRPPDLVVCDSQVVQKMVADTPRGVKCTTFSILFARAKGDLALATRGAAALARCRDGDRVLVAEACSHHALEDDIGRVKLPRWLRQYSGARLQVDVCAGRDYPARLADYRVVIHCGGCMLNRREMLSRQEQARAAGVAITNYGVAIAFLQGVLERVLEPFPAARNAFRAEAVNQHPTTNN